MPLARFDPARYLTPLQVERGAQPKNPALMTSLPLSGFESGSWRVRLFITESGTVDEVEVVEARGNPRNVEELRTYFAAANFDPALKDGAAVKSQAMFEISFEPSVDPGLFRPAPVPSAEGK